MFLISHLKINEVSSSVYPYLENIIYVSIYKQKTIKLYNGMFKLLFSALTKNDEKENVIFTFYICYFFISIYCIV